MYQLSICNDSRVSERAPVLRLLRVPCLAAWCLAVPWLSAVAGTSHVAIGRFESITNLQKAVTSIEGETLMLVGKTDSLSHYLRVVTVDVDDGSRKGAEFKTNLPRGACYPTDVAEVIYSKHFLPGYALAVGARFKVATIPIAIQSSGTPVGGAWGCLSLPVDTLRVGHVRALGEINGGNFSDGRPRLFVGTDSGLVLAFTRSSQGVSLAGQYDLGQDAPIADLGPLPQYSFVALGVVTGHQLSGWRIGTSSPQLLFRLSHPTGTRLKAFRTFEPNNQPLTSAASEVSLAFCDGRSDRLSYATLPATLAGEQPLSLGYTPPAFEPPTGGGPLPFSGSLLLLVGPTGEVRYQLGYLNGASAPGCMTRVSDSTWQPCVPCPVVVTGDVDNTGAITASDVIRLVWFVFKGGAAPQPCRAAGDVDCSGVINASDVIAIINFVFKSGKAPCNICSQFNGTWTCP